MRTLRGGSISTETTNRPAASAWPSREPRSGRSTPGRGRLGERGARHGARDDRGVLGGGGPRSRAARVARLRRLDRAAVERGAHGRDVGRRRAAAAADDPRTGVEQPRHDRAEPGRLGRVHEPAVEALGQAGVGHDRARRVAVARRRRSAPARRGRPSGPTPQLTPIASTPAAVRANDGRLGGRAVGERDVVAERHRRDHRDIGRTMGLVDGEQQVREVEEGLEHEQVGAALEQPVDLLAEGGPDRRLVGMAELAGGRPERPDAAAHPRVAAAHVAGLAGHLGGAAVELGRLRPTGRRRRAASGSPRT